MYIDRIYWIFMHIKLYLNIYWTWWIYAEIFIDTKYFELLDIFYMLIQIHTYLRVFYGCLNPLDISNTHISRISSVSELNRSCPGDRLCSSQLSHELLPVQKCIALSSSHE